MTHISSQYDMYYHRQGTMEGMEHVEHGWREIKEHLAVRAATASPAFRKAASSSIDSSSHLYVARKYVAMAFKHRVTFDPSVGAKIIASTWEGSGAHNVLSTSKQTACTCSQRNFRSIWHTCCAYEA